MAAVVRVKRRLEDDPVDSLVLLCKKVKTGADVACTAASPSDSTDAVKSVFKFAGTVTGSVSMKLLHGLSKNRRDRTEHPSRTWRPYRCPDDETGRTTGRRDSLTGDDGTSNMFSHTD